MANEKGPDFRSRMLAMLIGPFYVLIISAVFAQTTRTPPFLSLLQVVGGASVIMIILGVFGVRASRYESGSLSFNISTAFLVVVLLSIYLAAIRHVLSCLPVSNRLSAGGWFGVAAVTVLFVILSTAILMWLAEALMWIALMILRGLIALGKANQKRQ